MRLTSPFSNFQCQHFEKHFNWYPISLTFRFFEFLRLTFWEKKIQLIPHCPKSYPNSHGITWNVVDNMIQHEIFRDLSRFPCYISWYIAEIWFLLGQGKCIHFSIFKTDILLIFFQLLTHEADFSLVEGRDEGGRTWSFSSLPVGRTSPSVRALSSELIRGSYCIYPPPQSCVSF